MFSSSAREADRGSQQQAGTQKGKIKTLQKRERVPTGNLSHRAPTFKQESPESVSLFQSEVLKTFVNRAGRVKKKKVQKCLAISEVLYFGISALFERLVSVGENYVTS